MCDECKTARRTRSSAIYTAWSSVTVFCLTSPLGDSRRNIATPFGMEKLEWRGYPIVKKFWRYVYSFWYDPRMWQTDGRTDTAWWHRLRLCIASHDKNTNNYCAVVETFRVEVCSVTCLCCVFNVCSLRSRWRLLLGTVSRMHLPGVLSLYMMGQ